MRTKKGFIHHAYAMHTSLEKSTRRDSNNKRRSNTLKPDTHKHTFDQNKHRFAHLIHITG